VDFRPWKRVLCPQDRAETDRVQQFLVFFLKDAGFTTILIVVATAVIAGLVLLPWSNVKAYDEEDLIDWDLVNYPSDKDD